MKPHVILLVFGAIILCAVAGIGAGVFLYHKRLDLARALAVREKRYETNTKVPSTELPPESRALIDVDALAARMKTHQDLYQKLRDDGLAAYARNNPTPHPWDDRAKETVRLYAYLCVWGDFYGEGLWRTGYDYAIAARNQGAHEAITEAFVDAELAIYARFSPPNENYAAIMNKRQLYTLGTDYPAPFRMTTCLGAIDELVSFKREKNPPADSPSLSALPDFIQKWGELYRQMIQEKVPNDILFALGSGLQSSVSSDESTLDLVIAEQDRDFDETDPHNPVRLALDGNYYVDAAWNARGSGWANSVTDQGWLHFRNRLSNAAEVLEDAYAKYPNEPSISCIMIRVELGQGQGKDRMEMWFQRAITANPDYFDAYKAKEWYLQPRWYGSEDDILNFGQQCIQTGNWQAKIPMILNIGISEISDQDPDIYKRTDVWTLVEKTYRDYLDRYPGAIYYRTLFAKHAYDSQHLDIAREQFKVLGHNWDRAVLSEAEYATMAANLGL